MKKAKNKLLRYELMDSEEGLNLQIEIKKLLDNKMIYNEYYKKKHNLTFTITFIMENEEFQTSFIFSKNTKMKKIMDLNLKKDLFFDKITYNSQLNISVWLYKGLEDEKCILTTTFDLFDKKLVLKEGTFLLIGWPFTNPKIEKENFTPSEIKESFLKNITQNYFAQFEKNLHLSKFHQGKNTEAFINQNIILNKNLPLPFLELQIKVIQWSNKVLIMDHPKSTENSITKINNLEIKNIQHPLYKFYIEDNIYNYLYKEKSKIGEDFLIARDNLYDYQKEDPVLQMYLGNFDDENVVNLRPNKAKKKFLSDLIKRPNFYHFSLEEKAEIWKYRYYLSDNSDALTKFLISVNWMIEKNIETALEFLEKWKKIDYDDALFLLSKKFSRNDVYQTDLNIKPSRKSEILGRIRDYAVGNLGNIGIKKIEFLILQLVSSLRYDSLIREESSLIKFLFENVRKNKKLSTKFYWNVNVECDCVIEEIRNWYKGILNWFVENIKLKKDDQIFQHLLNQINLREILRESFENCIKSSRNTDKMTEKIREFLSKKTEIDEIVKNNFFLFEEEKLTKKFCPEKTKVFNSNTRPIRLTFLDYQENQMNIMYKLGDDMRQDQLIMQMISLMDFLLTALNVDLRLTIYQIMVYSNNDGIMEFVDNSETLQDVLEKNKEDLTKFLLEKSKLDPSKEKLKTKEKNLQNINKSIFDNYMESCASYCVITYLLGIGDRHLENLLITNDAKLFHIDFGYAMGEDPKPFPPPFKLNKPMINVFAGGFKDVFIGKCVNYYLYLRQNAKIILNLMHLMVDSDLVTNPNKDKKMSEVDIKKMAEKFMIEKSDVEAEEFFKLIINQSVDSILTNIWDRIHLYRARGWI